MYDLIDSHVHLDLIHAGYPERISWLRKKRCAVVTWGFVKEMKNARDLVAGLEAQADLAGRLSGDKLTCYYLIGVHPRNITGDLDFASLAPTFLHRLDDPLCLGIGEIGLETGSAREKEVLRAQLNLAGEVIGRGKKFGIHTPRNNKPEITDKLLAFLEDHPRLKGHAVIDHCSPETIGKVLERGFHAGVTLSPPKTSADQLRQIARDHHRQIDRIMCNTDSGRKFYTDLVNASCDEKMELETRERLFRKTASDFFNI